MPERERPAQQQARRERAPWATERERPAQQQARRERTGEGKQGHGARAPGAAAGQTGEGGRATGKQGHGPRQAGPRTPPATLQGLTMQPQGPPGPLPPPAAGALVSGPRLRRLKRRTVVLLLTAAGTGMRDVAACF